MPNVNLILLDESLCDGLKEEVPSAILTHNQSFLLDVLNRLEASQYSHAIFGTFTKNQDFELDKKAQAIKLLPLLQSFIANNVDQTYCQVILDPFLIADIFSGKKAGESFKEMLQELNGIPSNHVRCMEDISKISILYAASHRVAMLHKDDIISIDIYEADQKILYGNVALYQKHPDALPNNVKIYFHERNADGNWQAGPEIKGSGIIDQFYEWSVRYLATQYFFSVGPLALATNDRCINSAEDLLTYQDNKSYCREDGRLPKMQLQESWYDHDKFMKFRANECPRLIHYLSLEAEANYTTAQELKNSHIIPDDLVCLPEIRESVKIPAQESFSPAPYTLEQLEKDIFARFPPNMYNLNRSQTELTLRALGKKRLNGHALILRQSSVPNCIALSHATYANGEASIYHFLFEKVADPDSSNIRLVSRNPESRGESFNSVQDLVENFRHPGYNDTSFAPNPPTQNRSSLSAR